MIPKILHHIWVGPDPFPAEFERYRKTWQLHHPAWELRLWTEENLPGDLRRREVYDKLRVPAERSDILRLELLYRYGGVYVDTDVECQRPLDPLIEGLDFFTAYLKPGRVNNAVIGSIPEHPIVGRALDDLSPREFYGYDKSAAGPLFFDELMKRYPDATVFPPEVFYPKDPAERRDAVTVHHVARSWKDDAGFRKAALLAEERLDLARAERDQARADLERTKAKLAVARGDRVGGRMRARVAFPLPERAVHAARVLAFRSRPRARSLLKSVRHILSLPRRKLFNRSA